MTSCDLEGHSYCNSSNDMACSRGPSAVAELLVKTQRRLHSVKMTTRSRAMSRAALTAKHDTLVRRAHQMLNAALAMSNNIYSGVALLT